MHQTSYIFNQWMCRSRVIFRRLQTCSVMFRHICMTHSLQPWNVHGYWGWLIIMWWLSFLPNMFKHVVYVGKSSYAWQFSFFNIFATLFSIHNSFTPTNIPIVSTQPFLPQYHFHFYIQPSVKLLTFPTSWCVALAAEWLDLPTVDIAQLAHTAGEYIFTMFNPYI